MYQEDIRIPDETKFAQLLEDNRSQYEKDIDDVILLSMKDISIYNTKVSDYERLILEEYVTETKNRHNLFEPILFEINKVGLLDKEIKEMYQIIKPIMDSYCNRFIDRYEFDELTYNFIFKNLYSLRISKQNIQLFEPIFTVKPNFG